MSGRIARARDIEWIEHRRGSRFGARRCQLGRAAGSRQLGCSLYEVLGAYLRLDDARDYRDGEDE